MSIYAIPCVHYEAAHVKYHFFLTHDGMFDLRLRIPKVFFFFFFRHNTTELRDSCEGCFNFSETGSVKTYCFITRPSNHYLSLIVYRIRIQKLLRIIITNLLSHILYIIIYHIYNYHILYFVIQFIIIILSFSKYK